MAFEEELGTALGIVLKELIAPLQRRIEQLEGQTFDLQANVKAMQQSDAATWRRPGIKIKGNEKHVQ
jgi:hypothetical protein